MINELKIKMISERTKNEKYIKICDYKNKIAEFEYVGFWLQENIDDFIFCSVVYWSIS